VERVGAFLEEVAAWADEQSDVHAVVLVGSHRRRSAASKSAASSFGTASRSTSRSCPRRSPPLRLRTPRRCSRAGFACLYDRGVGLDRRERSGAGDEPPTQERFDALSNDFWYRALWAVRFFERWAGDGLVEALGPTFARYEAADVARALRATGDLFRRLEDEVARRFGLHVAVDRREILRRLDALTA
jgi:hypothetical protein